jgi:hypothetical protein
MIYQLFDLTGREQYCCAIANGKKDVTITEQQPLHTLLIKPKDEGNKSPYLQDPENPRIEDFITPEGDFDYGNSIFLSEILKDEKSSSKRKTKKEDEEDKKRRREIVKEKTRLLEYYFLAQIKCLKNHDDSKQSIILVPDHYDAEKQERILHACQMPRNKTLLLWRSVAICLGAEEYFPPEVLHDGSKIAVIDGQASACVSIAILTMKNAVCNADLTTHTKDNQWLIPARRAYHNGEEENYPITENEAIGQDEPVNVYEYEFWRHVWMKEGKYPVPFNWDWKDNSFHKPKYKYTISSTLRQLKEVDIAIVSGDIDIESIPSNIKTIIREKRDENFAIIGAGRFAVRKDNDLISYYDECEPLYFIAQNPYAKDEDSRVVARELISGKQLCPGGSRHEGNVNKNDFVLRKGAHNLRFLLHVGKIDDETTQLKELIQHLPKQTIEDQPLTLSPSMIPGQGIANVLVEAKPLLSSYIELDFGRMVDAIDKKDDGTEYVVTKRYLIDSMKLSFPPNLPGVRASGELWDEDKVKILFTKRWVQQRGLFAKSRWPNLQNDGLKRFERNNVFGNIKDYQFPFGGDQLLPIFDNEFFRKLFKRIEYLYETNRENKTEREAAIRLAAWTYRCGTDIFQNLITDTLKKVIKKAKVDAKALRMVENGTREETVTFCNQEFTVCANMLSDKQKFVYVKCLNLHLHRQLKITWDRKELIGDISRWIRALHGILMDSSTFLEGNTDDENKQYESCMNYLFLILKNLVRNHVPQNNPTLRGALCCMLLLLRRRIYQHDFLSQDSKLFQKMKKYFLSTPVFNISQCSDDKDKEKSLANVFFNFLMSKGTLPDIASVAKDFMDDTNDND